MEIACELFSWVFPYIEWFESTLDIDIRSKRPYIAGTAFFIPVIPVTAYIIRTYQPNDRYDDGFKAGCEKTKKEMESFIKSTNCKIEKD